MGFYEWRFRISLAGLGMPPPAAGDERFAGNRCGAEPLPEAQLLPHMRFGSLRARISSRRQAQPAHLRMVSRGRTAAGRD